MKKIKRIFKPVIYASLSAIPFGFLIKFVTGCHYSLVLAFVIGVFMGMLIVSCVAVKAKAW